MEASSSDSRLCQRTIFKKKKKEFLTQNPIPCILDDATKLDGFVSALLSNETSCLNDYIKMFQDFFEK